MTLAKYIPFHSSVYFVFSVFLTSVFGLCPLYLCVSQAMEAEAAYKASVAEANERHSQLLRVKAQVLQQVRELMLQCDQTMKAVTVSYFQLQHTLSAPSPVQVLTSMTHIFSLRNSMTGDGIPSLRLGG